VVCIDQSDGRKPCRTLRLGSPGPPQMPLWDGMCLHHLHALHAVVAMHRVVVMETPGLDSSRTLWRTDIISVVKRLGRDERASVGSHRNATLESGGQRAPWK
jgi:hypothetical protein